MMSIIWGIDQRTKMMGSNKMKKVTFALGLRKYLPFIKEKRIICDSAGYPTVTISKSATVNDCFLEGKNLLYSKVSLNNVYLGYGTYINGGTCLFNTYIGAFSSVSSNVKIIGGVHPSGFVTTYPGFYSNIHSGIATYADDVYYQEFAEKKYYEQYTTYIGNDVLIGSGATLMEGIKVGDGAIVLPCAVVVDDVEPYAMVGGVPAQRKKYRFTKEDRTFLLESQWWKLDKSWLEENWKALHDIEVFKNAYEHFKKGI